MTSWKNDYIDLNLYARSGKKIKSVKKIVLHWTANNGAGDENHKTYFGTTLPVNNKIAIKNGKKPTYASAHIFVDKDSATCIIPLNEMSYHANDVQKYNKDGSVYRGVPELKPNANELSIGVEMCVEKDGTIHPDTITRTVNVMVELCQQFKLKASDIVRHFDVTAKNCPAPFVKDSSLFTNFKNRVDKILNPPKPVIKPVPKPVPYPNHLVLKGSKDVSSIRLIQSKLGIKVDGIFGSGTESAVIKFQKAHKLSPDGKVGKMTWNAMF